MGHERTSRRGPLPVRLTPQSRPHCGRGWTSTGLGYRSQTGTLEHGLRIAVVAEHRVMVDSERVLMKMRAFAGIVFLLVVAPAGSQERQGIISHPPLLKMVLQNAANLEVAVYETEYAPGGINPRHLHPAAVTFYVLSGTGVWQEEGKPPVTLKAGDSLFVPAGTIHSHRNPSGTDRLRFLEFIVAEKDNGRSIPRPLK